MAALFEAAALLATATFFGAALYVNVVQHPASLEAGAAWAGRFFAPMYRRAAAMQAGLALVGSACAAAAWGAGAGAAWGVGALLLIAVVPYTFAVIMPVNRTLLAADRDAEAPETEALLRRWASLHAVRTALSGAAVVAMLWGR